MSHPAVHPGRPQVVVPCGATLGEGPVWDPRIGALLFVDCEAGAIYRWHPGTDPRRFPLGEAVGFVVLTPDPEIVVLGLRSGVARFDLRDGSPEILVRPEPDRPRNRLNDGVVAPDGSLYFGSMDLGEGEPNGRFYRWGPDGLAPFGSRAVVTNGPAIDPERGLLYAADTVSRQVFKHSLGPAGPGPAQPFVTFGEGDGYPDGMAVDEEGHVWIAHWGGSRVTRFSPAGDPVLVVPVPTAQVTKPAFGGPDLRTLYVTTAARRRDRETDPMAGHVFAFETGIRGLPSSLFRVPL